MAIKRFSSTFKTRNDVMDNITPNNVVQPHIAVPAGEWKPARYLPVQWTGEASKDAFVISSGKVVCLDTTGRVSDMNMKAFADNIDVSSAVHTDPFITYDSTDVAYGVYSIATGQAASAGAVSIGTAAAGLIDQGLVVAGRDVDPTAFQANNSFDSTDINDCKLVLQAFWSEPVGVAAYDVYCWAGDTPDELVFTNYQKQHMIQFITEIQLRLPVIAEDSSTAASLSALSGNTFTSFATANSTNTNPASAGDRIAGSDLKALDRYEQLTNSDFVGVLIDPAGISSNTDRTPITEASATFLLAEKKSPELLKKAGDYFVDGEVGLILFYSAGGVFGAGVGEYNPVSYSAISYYAKVGASQQYRHAHMVGPCRPGDRLSYDAQSNICVLASDSDALGTSNAVSIGRVMEIIREPKGLLDRVETAFTGSSFSASAKMPGTATKGFSDMITLSSEVVADELVTLIVRF